MVAEQGHCPIRKPFKQRLALRVRGIGRIGAHPVLQRLPVANRQAHVAEHSPQIGRKRLPAPRIGTVQLDIHHRFPPAVVFAQRSDGLELASVVALDTHDWVEQPVDGQLAGCDGIGNRIDQEGHVIVDDADTHPAPSNPAAD